MDWSCLVCVLAVYVVGTNQDILKGICELTTEGYDCSDQDLQSVPDDLPSSIQILDFSFNHLHVLCNATFVRLKELLSLDLTRCKINWIYEDVLSNQKHLKSLILTGNPLMFVSDLAFVGPQSLKYIGLSQTAVRDLRFIPYTNLESLETLELGDNDIQSLSGLSQFNWQTMKTLNLQMNSLQHLTTAEVAVFKNTKGLDLSFKGNSIISIESKAFESCRLNSLDFSDCFSEGNFSAILEGLRGVQTNRLSLGVYEDSSYKATIAAPALQAFCDISVKELSLQLQHFSDLAAAPFHCLGGVQKLDLTRAHLRSLPGAIADMTSLSTLILDQNKFSDLCLAANATALLPSLAVLSVRGNLAGSYMTFTQGCLRGLSHLVELDLSHSSLWTGPACCETQLAGLSGLRTLNLSYNFAMRWSPLPFSAAAGLEVLDCYRVNVTRDPRDTGGPFRNLKQLRVLNILWTFADLSGPENLLLQGLTNLLHLSLRRSSIKDGTLSNTDMFVHVPLLESLVLAECGLLSVNWNLFSYLGKLGYADLSGNRLAVVSTNALSSLDNILISLAKNSIEMIDIDSLKGLEKGGKIDLSDNPLACNCSNIDFINWIQSNTDKVVNKGETRCDRFGDQLSDVHLNCAHYGILVTGLVVLLMGVLLVACVCIRRQMNVFRYTLL